MRLQSRRENASTQKLQRKKKKKKGRTTNENGNLFYVGAPPYDVTQKPKYHPFSLFLQRLKHVIHSFRFNSQSQTKSRYYLPTYLIICQTDLRLTRQKSADTNSGRNIPP
uniref:Uncharacterized protein n=1 Tax=Trypanosoma congolense (strain IL3000) TaxID=1068625 RepID=G0V0Q0_TRYCI|nr:hypothetical protein, unlikely [Trypanosoma congolense IL3000]